LHLAAVVLTLGKDDSYQAIVADLLAQGVPAERICVAHNPLSVDEGPVEVPPGAQALRMPHNLGYAAAMNAGLRHHLERGADWIWLLTQDVRLRQGAADAMRAAAETPDYGALGPKLLQAGTEAVFSLGGARTRFGWPYNEGFGRRLGQVERKPGAVHRCAWVDGSSIMLRSRALQDVGLYDTSLFGYAEDAMLCLRLERAGWPAGVVQDAAAEQVSGQLSRPGLSSYLIARNCLRYARAAAGRPAIAALLARYLRQTIHQLRVAVTGPRRRVALIQCYATWAGALAFFAGRTGPPPPHLPGRGELGAG
jgi:GT2 family glycosyltransferase